MADIEIFEYEGAGYNATMNFEQWRVAIANYGENFERKLSNRLERHMLTDEVFVLLQGEATLVIGNDRTEYVMEPGKIYNVKKAVWHNIFMDESAKVLIVENHNTCRDNTEYYYYEREEI